MERAGVRSEALRRSCGGFCLVSLASARNPMLPAAGAADFGTLAGKSKHAVSTAGVCYFDGLICGRRPAALSSAMISRRLSMPSRVKAGTPSSPMP